jgi:hypothetical protein
MNAKYRAKRAREEVEEWDGPAGNDGQSDSDSDSESEEEMPELNGTRESEPVSSSKKSDGKLSNRAKLFFDQPDFDGIDLDSEDDKVDEMISVAKNTAVQEDDENSDKEDDFEIVPAKPTIPESWSDDSDGEKEQPVRQGKFNIEPR